MGKPSAERRLADNEASAFLRALRTSPRKLNLVAAMIRGKAAQTALAELTFSRRRIAQDVKKVLQSAIANAFGDRYIYNLCPSAPDARAYAIGLAQDVTASYPVMGVSLETPGFLPYAHGFHHEFALNRPNRWLDNQLGLCFCAHCQAGAKRAGIPVERMERVVGRIFGGRSGTPGGSRAFRPVPRGWPAGRTRSARPVPGRSAGRWPRR